MPNTQLFSTQRIPATNTVNEAGGTAYKLPAKTRLLQYLMTGTFNGTFYATAKDQLDSVLELTAELDAEFIAKAAIYARKSGYMKDTPALLTAVLTKKDMELAKKVFVQVIDNGRMVRNFVQFMRSGVTGRKSLGSAPRNLVRGWLENASDMELLNASVGQKPSLADIVKMVHPKPANETRETFYKWLLGNKVDETKLSQVVQDFEHLKKGDSTFMPSVDFRLLTSLELSDQQWKVIARNAPFQMTRMNLNTFARHKVFEPSEDDVTQLIADRLSNPELIRKSKVYPYQLMVAYTQTAVNVPDNIRDALRSALNTSLENIPMMEGKTWILIDISGSMSSPVTGIREGATSVVKCIDVAALLASALLRKNPTAGVIVFNDRAGYMMLDSEQDVIFNAKMIADKLSGGTAISTSIELLNRDNAKGDTLIVISDNESWSDTGSDHTSTRTMRQWEIFRTRNPGSKLVCIDIQPNSTAQTVPREDILQVGGFSDAVFDTISSFASGQLGSDVWENEVNQIVL